jgi:hypothetical protein
MINIKIFTGGAAFEDDYTFETARVLREIADKIEAGREPASINDINGNKCVRIEYIED